MGQYYKKIVFLSLFLVVLISVFIFGQIFYYNKTVTAAIRNTPVMAASKLTADLANALQQKFVLKYQEVEVPINSNESKTWIESYTRNYTGKQELRINTNKILAYLEKISQGINIPPKNARLIINNDGVSEFEPPQPGRILDISATANNVTTALAHGDYKNGISGKVINIELIIVEKQPGITLDKINNLGINVLLARGESDFSGSSKSRVHNISVGSKKFTGILVKPGENFSFNKFLDNVDASSGYLPELVIKNGTLIPEYGGGLCQVSTTLFRAVALAGLPILERHPHSLPVRYYNPQGFDATIYPGVSDLKFKNDTPAYILIQSEIIGSKIYFEIYGTDDSRKITLDGPRQYDIKPSGALKAELTRTVIYPDGTEKKDVFQSSYKAPGSFPTIRNPLE